MHTTKSSGASPLRKHYSARIRNGVSVYFWTAKVSLIRRSSATGTCEFDWPVDNLAIHSKSQTDLVGKEDSYLADRDLCPTGLAQRKGLTRSQ
jgi:hypothetical protein